MSLLDDAQKWAEFVSNYGAPKEVPFEVAKNADPNKVWTLWSRGSDYLVNEFKQGEEVISYWLTANPWQGEEGQLFYAMTIWIDCPTCSEMFEVDEDWDQDECEECEGSGTLAIDLDSCLNAETEQEVFEMRRAL